jgi:hypothetical protein
VAAAPETGTTPTEPVAAPPSPVQEVPGRAAPAAPATEEKKPAGPPAGGASPGGAAPRPAAAPAAPSRPAAGTAGAGSPAAKGPPAKAAPAPVKQAAAAPAASKPAPPPLDLKALESRLKETDAIGVMTKLTLKSQVDELLDRFRAYHEGRAKSQVTELRQPYDTLMLKVLALLQDKDPPLADAIAASREAIWTILTDRAAFSNL